MKIINSESEYFIYILDILKDTTADGPGLRTSIYSSGCSHKCKGCHNPTSWNMEKGNKISVNELEKIIIEQNRDITFTGGDPFFQIEAFIKLASLIKEDTNLKIWCYTGYKIEDILEDKTKSELLKYIDVLVDGKFEEEQKDLNLYFRGSSNQRLIDVKATLKFNKVIIFDYNPLPIF